MALTFSHKHIKKCKMVHTEHVRNAGKRSWTLHVTGQSEREKRGRNRDRRGKKKKKNKDGTRTSERELWKRKGLQLGRLPNWWEDQPRWRGNLKALMKSAAAGPKRVKRRDSTQTIGTTARATTAWCTQVGLGTETWASEVGFGERMRIGWVETACGD